jgi:predicted Zn-dependent peptidase
MNFIPSFSRLANGINVITLNIPNSASVTALLLVKVGSRYEENKVAGISHFVEHMVFKGTKKYPTALDLTSTVDAIGAESNAFTSKEYTGFYVKAASSHLDLALDVLSQLAWHPLLPTEELERERGVIVEEINMYEDMPMAKVGESFESLLYGDTHLGREVIGFKETVLAVKRQDFLDYMNKWYQPKRMVLAIIGGVRESHQLAEKFFNKPNLANLPNLANSDPDKLTFVQQKPALHLETKKTEQAHMCLGVRAFPRKHEDRYVLSVLATVLGGNMSSRLFTEVREKRGLAYYVKSDVGAYFDNGYLISQAGADVAKIQETIKVILNEYRKIATVKLTSKELNKARDYLKGKLALALEDSKVIASFYTEDFLLEGKVRTPEEMIREVNKVTVEDILRVAKQIFIPQGLNLAVIGPYKDKTTFEKLLKI